VVYVSVYVLYETKTCTARTSFSREDGESTVRGDARIFRRGERGGAERGRF